jgi:hypothetical protein
MAATAEGVRLSMMGPLGGTLQHVDGLPPPDLALPALEPVNSRETYRTRPDDELEDATWFSAEQEDTLVPPTKTRLRSIHSKQVCWWFGWCAVRTGGRQAAVARARAAVAVPNAPPPPPRPAACADPLHAPTPNPTHRPP